VAGNWPGEYLDKDVGHPDAWYTDLEWEGEKVGYQTLVIQVDNAYPEYFVNTVFGLHNIGSIPLHVYEYVITGQKQEKDGTPIHALIFKPFDASTDKYDGALYEDTNNNNQWDVDDVEVINFRIQNTLPLQLEPCKSDKREVDLHFKQAMQQGKVYVFNVQINARQWAE
jgi:hypothetical protein